MELTNPIVVGPITVFTSPFGIRCTGQLIDADVSILTFPTHDLIASGKAVSSDQRFPLQPHIHSLTTDMKLYAHQELNGQKSPPPPLDSDMFMGVSPGP